LPEGNLVLRLSFLGQSAEEPVIATLIRQYQVTPNILYGNIDHIQSTPYGTLILELSGSQEDLDAALAYLKQRNLGIEVIGYVARHASLAG
jgi:D-methionine transport system ATP-binding protein